MRVISKSGGAGELLGFHAYVEFKRFGCHRSSSTKWLFRRF